MLLELALAGLEENLLADLRPDGVHCEASTHYHMVVLRSALGTLENARRFGLPLPAALAHRVERACEFALHAHRPDGGIAVLSDGDAGSYRDLLALASSLLRRPDFLYAATAGARGTPPRTRCASFPDGGYHVQRSGWGEGERAFEDELFLIFDCGPLGEGGHGHYDLLSVEVAAARRVPCSSIPGASPTRRGRPTSAAGSREPPRTTPSASTGATRPPTGAGSPRGRSRGAGCSSDSAHPDSTSCAASPRARATTPSTSGRSRSWRASTG